MEERLQVYRIIIIALFATACSSDDPDVEPIPPDSGEVDGSSDTGLLADTGGLADMFQVISDMATPDMAPDAGPMIAMGLEVGQRAPNFTLDDHTGNPVSLIDSRGQYTLVFGTSTW